jgi:uncharacterized protein (TIRG00374 family)
MRRRWLLWLILLAATWIFASRITEIENLIKTLAQGQLGWVLAALLLTGTSCLARAWLYRSAFAVLGASRSTGELLPVLFASLFANLAFPTAGAGGAALLVDDAARRGHSPARAAAGALLAILADYAAFGLLLIVGLGILAWQGQLEIFELIAAALFLILFCLLAALLFLGAWQGLALTRLLNWSQKTYNLLAGRFSPRRALEPGWAAGAAADLGAAGRMILSEPHSIRRTLLPGMSLHLINLGILFALLQAFHLSLSPWTLLAGYCTGILFWIVSITPQGIGFVEGMMILVFTASGAPGEKAFAAILAFRGLLLWLPAVAGFFYLRKLKPFNQEKPGRLELWGERSLALLTGLVGLFKLSPALMALLLQRLLWLFERVLAVLQSIEHVAVALLGALLLALTAVYIRQK